MNGIESSRTTKTHYSSSSQGGGNKEIRIMIPYVEENTRKLYEASKIGSIQTLKTLIREDPDVVGRVVISSSNYIEINPLHVSVLHGHLEFTRLLLDHKPELAAEVDALQQTPLHLASINGDVEIVRALLEKNTSACLVRDLKGLIPLHYAAIKGQIEIMQELINARPQSVWMKLANSSQTVLHLCAQHNRLEAIKLLTEIIFLNHDEDFLNSTDDIGNTVLDLSVMLRQIEIVGYLLSIPEVKTGKSTMDLAASDATKSCRKSTGKAKRRKRRESKKTTGRWQVLKKSLKYEGDWLQDVQGTLMLVATVIATVTFQGAIDPPGGVWQQDTVLSDSRWKERMGTRAQAGTAVMAYLPPRAYRFYSIANSTSFLASVSVILLIVSGFPLRNRICSGLLTMAMCVAVACLTFAYVSGTSVGSAHHHNYSLVLLRFWYGMVGVVILCCLIIPFFIWVSNRSLRILRNNVIAFPRLPLS